jgi:hypothetical protein
MILDENMIPGRITAGDEVLVERINNYLFQGEQYVIDVVAMDKNKIHNVKVNLKIDGEDFGVYEQSCKLVDISEINFTECNARYLEEEIIEFNPLTMRAYRCTLTALPEFLWHGPAYVSVTAEDCATVSETDEREYWFFNPEVDFYVEGDLEFDNVIPGTESYAGTVVLTNAASDGSGVLLDMFISGTDFYDSISRNTMCPYTNQLALENFRYFATNGAYSTIQDMEIGRDCDTESYCEINYGIGFNDPNPFYDGYEIIQAQKLGPYYLGNILAEGDDMAITFKLSMPEPCNGAFDEGDIYFWARPI